MSTYACRSLFAALVTLALLAPAALDAQERFMAPLPADAELEIHRDVVYRDEAGRRLAFDLYRPHRSREARPVPVAVMLNGIGADWMRAHPQYTGWGRYVTTAGFAGVSMDATEAHVASDFDALVAHLRQRAADWSIDPSRIIVWACSANVRAAVPLVHDAARPHVKGAVLYYGAGETAILRLDLPLMVVRAGLDVTGLNRQIDAMVTAAAAANTPVTMVNLPGARHGFDVLDDTDTTREALSRTLAFMRWAADPAASRDATTGHDRALASALLYADRTAEATTAYERLAAAHPQDPELAERLGQVRLARGEHRAAIDAYERALSLGTRNRGLDTFAIARAYTALGEIDRAIAAVERMGPTLRFFRDALLKDAEFARLRAHPRFAEVVK